MTKNWAILYLMVFQLTVVNIANAAPKITFKVADLLDLQAGWWLQSNGSSYLQSELNTRITSFQRDWDKAERNGILEISEEVAGKKFDRLEYTSWLSLTVPLIPMGRPLILNMHPFLENGDKPYSTLSTEHFISMNHHEVLHFLVENIEDQSVLFSMSSLANKYKEETFNVLAHLHLMAIQQVSYENMEEKGVSLLIKTNDLYRNIIKGDYLRAWEIVQKEGAQKFVDELKQFNKTGEDKVLYYTGYSEMTSTSSQVTYPREKIVLKKIISKSESQIVEIACAKDASDGKFKRSPVYMKLDGIRGDISDDKGFVTGTAYVTGTKWNWENLTFNMVTKFGGRTSWVDDVNIVVGPKLFANKSIFSNIGTEEDPEKAIVPSYLMTVEMTKIDREEYVDKVELLGCTPD